MHCLFHYLEEESSKDLHIESDYGPNIPDASTPPTQQLGGVHGSFLLVQRHHKVTLVSTRGLSDSMSGHNNWC